MTKIIYMNLPYSVRKYLTKIPAEVTWQDMISLRIKDEAMGLCTKRLLK